MEAMKEVLAVINQKGGVGKTTSAINIASCLAAAERKTLIIDMDPQANASSGLGISKNAQHLTVYEVLLGKASVQDAILKSDLEYLDILPANTNLVGAEIELVSAFARETRLKAAIENLGDEYEFVLMDCPPSLGLLTVNALTAASGALVPVQCEYFAMEGLSDLMNTVKLIKGHLNQGLDLRGIILTMFDSRNNLARQVASEVRSYFDQKVFKTVIPRNVKLGECPSHGKSIINYDVRSKGAERYLELTEELILSSCVQKNMGNQNLMMSGVA